MLTKEMADVIEWLKTPAGEDWSELRHEPIARWDDNRDGHDCGRFATIETQRSLGDHHHQYTPIPHEYLRNSIYAAELGWIYEPASVRGLSSPG